MFIFNRIYPQNIDYPNLILSYSETKDLYFYAYDPPLIIRADYSNINEAVNEYPEELVQSILSARNQEWVDYNTLGGAEKSFKKKEAHFLRVATMNKDENYFELHHKLTFNMGAIPTALIKFYFNQEGEVPVSGCFVMQNVDGKWKKTSNSTLSTLSIAIMRFKTDVLSGIILGTSQNEDIINLRQRVTTNGSLDLVKFENEFSSWYSPVIDGGKIELFKDPNSW